MRAALGTSATAAGLLLLGALAGCGDSTAASGGSTPETPTSSLSSSAAEPSPVTSSASSVTSTRSRRSLPALSPLEGDPRVKAMRDFGAQYGRAVNAGSATYEPWQQTMSAAGRRVAPTFIRSDLKLKEVYPGPLPFTPLKVHRNGGEQWVDACVWSHGWGVDAKTRVPPEKKVVEPVFFQLSKVGGQWKVDTVGTRKTFSCNTVRVEGRPW